MKVLVSGSAGFICGYLLEELLQAGYEVIGLDNFSKYGRVEKSYDKNPRYKFVEATAKNVDLLKELLSGCDHFVASAAMIGGISYFHEFAYDLLAENERIIAAAFDAALYAHQHQQLQKITVMSSSMVFESSSEYPTPEGAERAVRRHVRLTAFRSWRPSTSRRARGNSTSCPTPSCGHSTALELARSAPSTTATFIAEP